MKIDFNKPIDQPDFPFLAILQIYKEKFLERNTCYPEDIFVISKIQGQVHCQKLLGDEPGGYVKSLDGFYKLPHSFAITLSN